MIVRNRNCYKSMVEIGLVKKGKDCCGEFDRSDKVYKKCLQCAYIKRERKSYGI